MKILVVDDQSLNRNLLSYILEDLGHTSVMATNGQEAVDVFSQDDSIQVILMDVEMPGMNGIEATRIICANKGARHVTIIFVTAFDDPDVLARCLQAGGDDFIPKPVNEKVLASKLLAHIRNQENYDKLKQAHEELRYHQRMIEREHQIVERVFANGRALATTDCDNLVTYTSPMSLFNGDVVLSAPSPSGGLYVLLGDFTGHGLSAAIGSLPVTGVFYDFAARQCSVAEMATEINRQLHHLLPLGMYCCAAIMHLSSDGKTLHLWQGGINDGLLVDQGKVQKLKSAHVPLGILKEKSFDSRTSQVDVPNGACIYFYTDGLSDAQNDQGDMFGEERIESLLSQTVAHPVKRLLDEIKAFQGPKATDDISLIELQCGVCTHRQKSTGEKVNLVDVFGAVKCLPLKLSFKLLDAELKNMDVIMQILNLLLAVPGMNVHREKLFTILSELYNNALEHGILGLSSSIKDVTGGFLEYYRLRDEKLNDLSGHFINIHIAMTDKPKPELEMIIEDSGCGFDADLLMQSFDQNQALHGRGLHLVKTLCRSLSYSEGGRKVTIIYALS